MAKAKKTPAKKTPAKKAAAKKPAKAAKKKAAVKKVVKKVAVKKPAAKTKPAKAKKAVVAKKKAAPAKKKVAKKTVTKPVAKKSAVIAKKKTVSPTQKSTPKPMEKKPTQGRTESIDASSTPQNQGPSKEIRSTKAFLNDPSIPIKPSHKPTPLPPPPSSDPGKTRYSDEELKEFETLIGNKLETARKELLYIKEVISKKNDSGTDQSGSSYNMMEEGSDTAEKENFTQLAARQQKFIQQLDAAMARIKNGTYGICVETGKLIQKERLIAVPHTQHSIEAKLNR